MFDLQFPWAVGSIMEAALALVVMTGIDHEPCMEVAIGSLSCTHTISIAIVLNK